MKHRRRFVELDALRGIAALWVVIFHYTFGVGFFWLHGDFAAANAYTLPIPNIQGLCAVDLFFIISGFVIFMTLEKTASLSQFAVTRISRLFPAFVFAVLLASTLAVALPVEVQTVTLSKIFANLTMLEQYIGVPPIDGVYWSLTFELGFYICIAFVFALGGLKHIEPIGALWVVASFIALKAFPAIGAHIPWRLQALTALPYAALFFSGILFYRLRQSGPSVLRILLLALCFAEYIAYREGKVIAIISGIYLLFGMCASNRGRFIAWRPLTFLGEISYALYLVHYPMGFRLQVLNQHMGLPPAANLVVTIAVAILLATLVTFAIDRPGQRAIKNLYSMLRRRNAISALAPVCEIAPYG